MIKPSYSQRFYLAAVLCCLWLNTAQAIDILQVDKIDVLPGLAWCAASSELSIEDVVSGGCSIQQATPSDLARGFDKRQFWLHFTLTNTGDVPITRWLTIGHPRLESITVYVAGPQGWTVNQMGLNIPFKTWPDSTRHYGSLPVTLAAASETSIWIQVHSQTAIDLSTTVWLPEHLQSLAEYRSLSVVLALGCMVGTVVFALLAFIFSHSRIYLYFSTAIMGEILIEAFRSGLLQRFFWPSDLPLPVEIAALGSLVAVLSFVAFINAFLPRLKIYRTGWRLFIVLAVITLVAQLAAISIDYATATQIWSITLNAMVMSGLWLIFKAWRHGMRSAGTMLASFVMLAVLELFRLATTVGILNFSWFEILVGPWALVMTNPVVLLSSFQQVSELREKLVKSQADQAAKSAFLTQMSHELRTPLDTILGNAQLLAQPDKSHRLLNDGLNSIKNSGWHLLRMIDGILDQARIETGKLKLEPQILNWDVFLQEISYNANLLAQQHENAFFLETQGQQPLWIIIDAVRLRQVLDNLVANAARHTKRGWIRLSCHALPKDIHQTQLTLSVQDSGEGIAAEDQARIFLPFERAASNQDGKGLGMGLAIAQQLVGMMGGELTLSSLPGQGATFQFSLLVNLNPDGEALVEADPVEITRGYKGRQRRILLIDDQDQSREVLGSLLLNNGFSVETVTNSNAASGVVNAVDLVITDQYLKDGSGWQVLQFCRAHQPNLPVLLISAAPETKPLELSNELAFDAFLMKPLNHRQLLHLIAKLLNLEWLTGHISNADPLSLQTVLLSMPSELELSALRQWIDLGQLTEIMAFAEQLKSQRPELHVYADQLLAAAQDIDFQQLYQLSQSTS